ncbi:MAG: trypsin-like peptidase domain-containing protein [Actinobacteria bacterium]|nr:trypsin-like peptidase domain-containing protein [Actinomycetota bacterium]
MKGTSTLGRSAGLVAAALLGGAVAIAGAALVGDLGGGTTTVIRESSSPPAGATTTSVSESGTLSINEIYRRSAPGVVQITSTTKAGTELDPFFGTPFSTGPQQALGSGFVIDKAGHVVTNYHVVEGADDIEVSFSSKDTLKAHVVGSDPSTDLAVLQVDTSARALTPLSLGDSDEVQVGDEVVAIGNPFGLDRTATAGIVSALQRDVTAPNGYTIDHVIQTDAQINSGNSGGPLLNARGEVIGVNAQIATAQGSTGNVGIGFAIPSNTVKSVVAQLIRSGKVERAFLGVGVRPIGPELSRTFRLPVDSGLLVENVVAGSGAAKAGLKGGDTKVVVAGESYTLGGDVIVAADGKQLDTLEELRAVLATRKPGDEISLEIYRGEKRLTLRVELGLQPASPQG